MFKKRIIPCLDVKDGQTVKGVNFVNIRQAGDPIELAKAYVEQGADELVFLDITATVEGRKTFAELVGHISEEINIPFTVGGGISSIEHVNELLLAGADKVSINSSAVRRPELINELSQEFGSQCIVLAIDTNLHEDGKWYVYTHGGRKSTDIDAVQWAIDGEKRGAGEILLTSMANDGTKDGFAVDITTQIVNAVNIPVIASGGAGKVEHFTEILKVTDAALAASIFHFGEIPVPELKQALLKEDLPIRWAEK